VVGKIRADAPVGSRVRASVIGIDELSLAKAANLIVRHFQDPDRMEYEIYVRFVIRRKARAAVADEQGGESLDGFQSEIVVDPAVSQHGLPRVRRTIEIGSLYRLDVLRYRQGHRRQKRRKRARSSDRVAKAHIRIVDETNAIVAHIGPGEPPQRGGLNARRIENETGRPLAGVVRKVAQLGALEQNIVVSFGHLRAKL